MKRQPVVSRDFTVDQEIEQYCKICKIWFTTEVEFEFHHPCYDCTKFSMVSGGYKCFKCKDSSIIYNRIEDLRMHAVEHAKPKFGCVYCETRTFHQYEMEAHVSLIHARELQPDSQKTPTPTPSPAVPAITS